MSLLSSFTKRSTLDAAVKQVAKARKSEAALAEQLYKGAYQGFATVIADNLIVSEALYNWGFALLHEAEIQPKEQAVETLEDAISKFSFCLLTAPNYLGAAIDGGVAFMELARLSAEEPSKQYLYSMAKQFFEKAGSIQKGSAAYNLACLYALSNDHDACLEALKQSKSFGSLPDDAVILADVDMASVIEQAWFKEFLVEARKKPEPEEKASKEQQEAISYEPKLNLRKTEDFDYYAKDEPK